MTDTSAKYIRRFWVLLISALGLAGQSAAQATTPPVVARMQGRYFEVSAQINGNACNLVVDTGAGMCALTPQAAKRLGVEGGQVVQAQGVGSETRAARLTRLQSMKVGDAEVKDLPVVVIELPEILNCDGLVGYSFLRNFVTTFDYSAHTLTFDSISSFVPPLGATKVELKVVQNHPRVHGKVAGIGGWFTLDSGANNALTLNSPLVKSNNLTETYSTASERIVGKGVGGFVMGMPAIITDFSLAGIAVPSVPGNLSTQTSGAMSDPSMMGNVGSEVLKRFVFSLDYVNRAAYFQRSPSFASEFRVDRSGVILDYVNGSFVIVAVVPRGPGAVAGLEVGDKVESINGVKLDSVHPLGARAGLEGPAGSKASITIRRSGVEREVAIVLRDPV